MDVALLRAALRADVALPALGRLIDTTRARPAAVVVPVVLAPTPSAIVVLRGSSLHDHPGEVGFPGGKPEPSDDSLEATALRELEEEIGVARAEVALLGALQAVPVITGRYLIHPFVGVLAATARPRVLTAEIARVIAVPLLPLVLGEKPIAAIRGNWNGAEVFAPHLELEACVLYGASAYILYELLLRLAAVLGVTMPDPLVTTEPPWGQRYTS